MGLLNLEQPVSLHAPDGFSINIAPWIWPNHHRNWGSYQQREGVKRPPKECPSFCNEGWGWGGGEEMFRNYSLRMLSFVQSYLG